MSAALLAKLIEAGTPAELVGEVAMELARAEAAQEILERRRAKDRERKSIPRNSTENAELSEKGSLEVSPHTPLPKPSKLAPLSPPKSRGKKTVSIQVPEWMPVEPWLAFVAMRERMEREARPKVIWSEDAAKGVIARIDKLRGEGHCPAQLLQKAVVSSWRTVFPGDDTKATAAKLAKPMTREEIGNAIRFAQDRGDTKRAAELERQLEKPPDRTVQQLIGRTERAVGVGK